MLVSLLIAAIVGYLLGSLPFGYLVARAKGVNIFEVGSRSSGATNVRRVLGNGMGALVLFLDALKGALAAAWSLSRFAIPSWYDAGDPNTFNALTRPDFLAIGLVGLLGALVGHSFSIFIKFRGGKGVATAAGGFLVLFPTGVLICAFVWGITLAVTRYVSLASMLAAVTLTMTAVVLRVPPVMLGACAAVTSFVIARHRTNISRLITGTENKMGSKPGDAKP